SGYIVAATTISTDGDLSEVRTDSLHSDIWIFKIDTLGKILWQKIFGGTSDDAAVTIIETGEAVYTVLGETTSNDGNVKGYHGGVDAWIFQFAEPGTVLWQKALGGSKYDLAKDIVKTSDGGYAITGRT